MGEGVSYSVDTPSPHYSGERSKEMEESHVVRSTVHSVYMAVDGPAEPIETRYGSAFAIQPSHVKLVWHSTPKDGWVLTDAMVHGQNLKKDGSLGVRAGKRDFEYKGQLLDDAPAWLVELVEQYRPTGVVLTP
jgi:hypothetical protein